MRRTMCMTCPICASPDVAYDCPARDRRRGLPGEWRFWQCARCGVSFQHPMPPPEQLRSLYAGYTTENEIRVAPSRGSRHSRLRRWYHHFTGEVDPRDFVHAPRGARVLDYGCGAAPYLSYFRSNGVRISG